MSGETWESYLVRWRDAEPWRAAAWTFLRPAEQVRFGALAALQEEWLKTLREVSEAQVAAVKLGWWREEIERATRGEARHPLTLVLFADDGVRNVPTSFWTAAVDAALLAVATPPAPDFSAQCQAARPLTTALAELETRVWFGPIARSPRALDARLFARLTANLRALVPEVGYGRSPLPMNLLARHGLNIGQLTVDGPGQRDALHDYMMELERGMSGAATMEGPLTLFAAIREQRDLSAVQRAIRSRDPLKMLATPAHGVRHLLKTWRAARTWRKVTDTGTTT